MGEATRQPLLGSDAKYRPYVKEPKRSAVKVVPPRVVNGDAEPLVVWAKADRLKLGKAGKL